MTPFIVVSLSVIIKLMKSFDEQKFNAEILKNLGFLSASPLGIQITRFILTGLSFNDNFLKGLSVSIPLTVFGVALVCRAREIMEERDNVFNSRVF